MQTFRRAKALDQTIIGWRRTFHQYPELSFKEFRTAETVVRLLEGFGIEVTRLAENCVVGKITGTADGQGEPKLAIRADMDALPIQEQTDLPFQSRHEGVMHACGHDGHMAMLLGAAQILQELSASWRGTVYVCFQSAEEVFGGSDVILAHLAAVGGVDRVIASHLWMDLPAGEISVQPGVRMAGNDGFHIEVRGRGGHASRPDLAIDPIKPLAQIVLNISAIPAHRISALEPCVVHVGKISGGTLGNIFPQTAALEGGLRTFDQQTRDQVLQEITDIAEATAAAWGAEACVTIKPGVPRVWNDPQAVELAEQLLADGMLFKLSELAPILVSENFGCFLEAYPGFMAYIGIRNEQRGIVHGHHHPQFDLDEQVLSRGASFFAEYALAYFKGGG